MSFKFGIIGGGWYGCHIATSLLALGFEVKLFEREGRLMNEASGNNQFRLHQGFHYARHSRTRVQSRDGFLRFLERYGDLSSAVAQNIYAVPTGQSLIDFDTYRIVMTSTGVHFEEVAPSEIGLSGVDGAMRTSERVLRTTQARAYFKSVLSNVLQMDTAVDTLDHFDDKVMLNGERFDYVIDASWGHFAGVSSPVFYEPTLLLYYEGPIGHPALTLVDGPLCSLYPTELDTLYTLSSVPHTPLGRYDTAEGARRARASVNRQAVDARRLAMETQIERYVPDFRDRFRYVGPQLSIKTKPTGAFDDRSCHVSKTGRVFTVLSGKIDTIFFAMERILSLLEQDPRVTPILGKSSIMSDVDRFSTLIENNQ